MMQCIINPLLFFFFTWLDLLTSNWKTSSVFIFCMQIRLVTQLPSSKNLFLIAIQTLTFLQGLALQKLGVWSFDYVEL